MKAQVINVKQKLIVMMIVNDNSNENSNDNSNASRVQRDFMQLSSTCICKSVLCILQSECMVMYAASNSFHVI